jgi:beta-glucosidase
MGPLYALRECSSRVLLLVLLTLTACRSDDTPSQPPPPDDWPKVESVFGTDAAIEAKIDALLQGMTLEEKIGQMTQVEIQGVTPEEIKQYHIGSVLNGGGSFPGQKKDALVQDWLTLADQLWAASVDPSNPHPIPILWGTDAVHGHNNVRGATLFPHNIGLGAANDPDLIQRIGEVTAREVARTGIDWVFAPTLAVVRDDRWGRTYEGYSEDPAIVEAYASKAVQGLQGQLGKDAASHEKVVATAKHFIGDGGTLRGKDQGITQATERELREIHGRGYVTALNAGAQTVMASFSSWKNLDQGEEAKVYKMHGNSYLLSEVLKTRMGFDGFVISDWNGHGQLTRNNSDSPADCTNSHCPAAINAGVDMMMVPYSSDWKLMIANTIASVRSGEIAQERIDDAVRRILRVKYRAGLFDKPKPSLRTSLHEVGTAEHRAVAREAVRKSLVLLKNNGGTLPLARTAKVLVAGKSANSLQNQTGGWSLTWQGTGNANADFGGGTTLWQAIQRIAPKATLDTSATGVLGDDSYDAAVVMIGETPYAEGQGDLGNTKTLELARLHPEDLALIEGLKSRGVKKIVTVLLSGRPLYTSKELNRSDAFVAAWLPGTEGDGVAEVLFRKEDGSVNFDFSGKLSYSWPKAACQTPLNRGDEAYEPLYAYGYGLTYAASQEQGLYDETSRDTGCGVDSGGGTATVPLSFFDRGNQDTWVMRIGAPSNWGGVDVVQGTSASTKTPAGEITATPVDDRDGLQWAAVKATWNNATAQLYIQNTNPNEGKPLQGYLNSNGALVLDMRVSVPPSGAVKARVDCVYPCGGEIDVTEALKALPAQTWTEVAIPLQCFSSKGADFTNINTPLVLFSEGTFELTVARIRWEPNKEGNVPCGSSSGNTTQISGDKDAYVNGVADAALFGNPNGWSYGSGSVTVNPALDTAEGKVIDVAFSNVTDGGGNGGFVLAVKDPTLLDVSPIASTGGVQFELKVLDYGNTTQDFWVKLVCDRKPDSCATGDLKTLVGHPPVGTWHTVKIPFASPDYASNWDATRLSSVLELLPAWDDQRGNIHFQLRNIRIVKQLN